MTQIYADKAGKESCSWERILAPGIFTPQSETVFIPHRRIFGCHRVFFVEISEDNPDEC